MRISLISRRIEYGLLLIILITVVLHRSHSDAILNESSLSLSCVSRLQASKIIVSTIKDQTFCALDTVIDNPMNTFSRHQSRWNFRTTALKIDRTLKFVSMRLKLLR